MAFRRRSLAAISLMLCFVHGLCGQSAQTANAQAEFRVISLNDLTSLFYDSNGKKEVLRIGIGTFTRLYPAPRNRKVELYTEQPNPDLTKPPIKAPLAIATLPEGEGPFLIILYENIEDSGLKFKTLVIDHSLSAHPPDNYRVYNFSKRKLAVNLADQSMLLNRGQSETVPYPDTRKAWLKVAADQEDDGWLLVTSSPHVVGNNSRTTIFLVDLPVTERDPDPKGIAVRRMKERITTDELGVQHLQ